ncbi:MAG: phosphatidylcholine/phosphatidylserine synthase [Lentisphaeria bacterium]|nr:phosphatidylcholine/phosphatidylserine synthase [Lentisphaeria bacterium]
MTKRFNNTALPRRKPVRRQTLPTRIKRRLRWVPNTLTLCNSWCGFASILWTLSVYERASNTYDVLAVSALIILGAMVFDVLDGFAARMLNATSMHGLQMDSLSDMVTFGVAPAVLMAVLTHWLQGVQTSFQVWVTYLLCSVYVGCAALRLATYNVKAMEKSGDSNVFHGLPSPGAAAAIVSLVLAMRVFDRDLSNLALVLPIYAAILGVLMVSPLPYRHLGKWLLTRKNNQPIKIMILVVLLFLVAIFREYAIFSVITLYVLSGPVEALRRVLTGSIAGKK